MRAPCRAVTEPGDADAVFLCVHGAAGGWHSHVCTADGADSGGRARGACFDVRGVDGAEVFGFEVGGEAAGVGVDDDWAAQ